MNLHGFDPGTELRADASKGGAVDVFSGEKTPRMGLGGWEGSFFYRYFFGANI